MAMRNLAMGVLLVMLGAPAMAVNYNYFTIDAPLAGAATVVTGINSNNQAAGYYVDPTAGPFGTYYSFTSDPAGGGFTTFTRPGYEQTGAAGINDAGQIVGVSVLTFGTGGGFLRQPDGSFVDIVPQFGGIASAYSEAIGINDSGTIVGFYTDVVPPSLPEIQAYSHGFVLQGGVFSRLDVPDAWGFGTQLYSVSNTGFVTGGFIDAANGAPHGFIWSAATGFVLPAGPAPSGVGAINDDGLFTYSLYTPAPLSPLGYTAASYVKILTGPRQAIAVPGAYSTETLGLNNAGQVTGYYLDGTGVHGFVAVATPAPEPATWGMMIVGFGATGLVLRRRRPVAGGARPA